MSWWSEDCKGGETAGRSILVGASMCLLPKLFHVIPSVSKHGYLDSNLYCRSHSVLDVSECLWHIRLTDQYSIYRCGAQRSHRSHLLLYNCSLRPVSLFGHLLCSSSKCEFFVMLIVVFCYKAHLSHLLTLTNITASGSSILLVNTTVGYCEILGEKVEMRLSCMPI